MPGAPPPVVLAAQHEGENFSRVSVFEWDNRPSLATLLGVMTQTRRPVLVGISLALLLALGAGVAFVIGDELGIRSEPADVPTEALVAAQGAVGFPIGHASAQQVWRGLRSRPTWRVLCYSAEDPPMQRGLVLVDAIDGDVVQHLVEPNPDIDVPL